jgi:hypothetical protein
MTYSLLGAFVMSSLALGACAEPEATAEDEPLAIEEAALDGAEGVTASFFLTCRQPAGLSVWPDGSAAFAYSFSCRRRNGTWGPYTSWSGRCYGDVTNCNGQIRCGC